MDAARHRQAEAMKSWSCVRSQFKYLIDHDVFLLDSVQDITDILSDLDDFFAALDSNTYEIGICSRIHTAASSLLPRLARLITRHNFADLLRDIVGRFENYSLAVQSCPAAKLRTYDEVQSFWEQLRTTYVEVAKDGSNLTVYVGGLAFMVGAITSFADRAELRHVPGLEAFAGDVVKLSDIVGLMGRYQRARIDWDRFWVESSFVMNTFLGQLAQTVVRQAADVRQSTAKLNALAARFRDETIA